jgi:hypothetical protein
METLLAAAKNATLALGIMDNEDSIRSLVSAIAAGEEKT